MPCLWHPSCTKPVSIRWMFRTRYMRPFRLDISIPRPILKGHRFRFIGSDPTRFWRWSYCHPKFQCTRCFPSSPQAQRCPFSPPVVTTNSIFPSVLAQYTTTKPPYLLGNVRIQVRKSLQAAQSTDTFHVPSQDDVWHGHFALETYSHQSKGPIQIPVYQSGTQMGPLS